ncbi:DUF6409 family protein [Streptomyces sp. NPDC007875]|uniref:DUF6409 family protein n=1 Tax=Streptomyces sp. NPDC007875 TaxID=3364783 RepID=UPI0036AAE5C2
MAIAVSPHPPNVLAAGTVVRCWHWVDGRNLGVRKAIVLGSYSVYNPAACYWMWFYTLGPASRDEHTVCHSFPREITTVGTVEDMSERMLAKVVAGLADFPEASAVRDRAAALVDHLRKARLARRR